MSKVLCWASIGVMLAISALFAFAVVRLTGGPDANTIYRLAGAIVTSNETSRVMTGVRLSCAGVAGFAALIAAGLMWRRHVSVVLLFLLFASFQTLTLGPFAITHLTARAPWWTILPGTACLLMLVTLRAKPPRLFGVALSYGPWG
jgi:hypothetical protein